MFRILGVDPSLTGTGVARLAVHDDGRFEVELEVIKTKGTLKDSLWERSRRQRAIVERVFGFGSRPTPDLTVIESPAYSKTQGSAHDRSGLWWRVADVAIMYGQTIEVTPNQRIKYALGKGVGDKDAVLAAAIRRYPDVDMANNNEADAFLLAALGARILGAPIEESLPARCIEVAETLVTG